MTQQKPRNKVAQDVHKRVVKILSEQLGVLVQDVLLDSTMEDHGGDSLDGIEIQMHLEEEFITDITDCEIEKIKSTRDIIALILPKIIENCSFDDGYNLALGLEDSPVKNPAAEKTVRASGAAQRNESRPRHLDDLFEYTISDSAMAEFVKIFNTVFSTSQTAYLYADKTKDSSDTWRIRMTTLLTAEAVEQIARFVESAGFVFVKSTEHLVQMQGSENYSIVTAIHLSLVTHSL